MGYRIKQMSIDYKVATMPRVLREAARQQGVQAYGSIAIFIFFIPYSAAVFIGLSYLFKVNFGIDYTLALVFMGSFTALYLVMGGYKSMTMIDVIFGMIMAVGAVVLIVSTLGAAGGFGQLTSKLDSFNPLLTAAVGPPGLWPLLSLVFLTSVAPFAMPQLVQKFYAIRDRKAIRIGMVASTGFSILIATAAYFTGATCRVFLTPERNSAAFSGGKPIVDALMPEMFTNVIPQSLSVLMLLLVLAASMSTLAALVLLSSSSVAKDFYAGFINRNITDKNLTLLMRFCSASFVLLSVVLAYFKPATIVAILGISWGAIGSAFLGPFLWGIFSKRTNKVGAFGSSLLGLAVCIVLYTTGTPSPQAGTIGMLVSLTTPPLISLMYRSPQPELP